MSWILHLRLRNVIAAWCSLRNHPAVLAVALADRLCIGRRVCGLFRIAEIRAVERTLKNLRKPFIGVSITRPLHDVTVRLAVTALVSEQDFATK